MRLDHDSCYRIVQTRDARYDGRLFVGVKTTGVYCRPICPARTPAAANVLFFPSAAAAQDAGFRPCLRCRPDVAPDLAAWGGSASTVTRALRLIDGDAPVDDIETLAGRLGVGSRQLRRLFAKHVGATPGAVLRTRRVHLARQLIQDTGLPVADIAFASGFGSVRRFNETFKEAFGRAPGALRRTRPTAAATRDLRRGLTVRLAYSAPYGWDEMLAFLGARAAPGVETVAGNSYARSISVAGHPGVIAVQPGRAGELRLQVHCERVDQLSTIVRRVRGLFDLDADPRAIGAQLGADRLLAPLVAARPGLRVAGAWDGFELAVRAVLGQQITVVAARTLAGRLVTALGERLDASLGTLHPGVTHLFPTPRAFASDPRPAAGIPGARARALVALAQAVASDASMLAPRRSLDDAVRALTSIHGIGPWTAQYIAMRELRDPDAFPATDGALLRAVERLTGRRVPPADLLARAERWRPWRAYGAAHLWASLGSTADADTEMQVA